MSSPQHPVHVAPPRVGIRSVALHLILLTLTAVMLAFSFAPRGHAWLAYVALFPAGLLAARAASAKRLAWTAFVVFWLWWLAMTNWVVPVTQGGYFALSALMAGYWALALVITHTLHRRYRAAMIVLLPIAWVACEWLRGRFLAGGFSWFMLGQSQGAFTPGAPAGRIVQSADLFGELGVSMILVMTSGLLVDLLTRPIMRPIGQNKHRMNRTTRGALLLWLLVIVGAWFYGGYRIAQWQTVTTPGPRVAVIQTNVPQDNKVNRTAEQDLDDWRDMVDLTRKAGAESPMPDLIVWPETMVPTAVNPEAVAYFSQTDTFYAGGEVYHEYIRSLALELGTNLLVGAPAYEGFVDETIEGKTFPIPMPRYNASFLYYADGEQAPLRYDKMHRVPFGEFIPWVGAIPPVKSLFIKLFTPYTRDYSLAEGEALTVFDIPVMPAGDEDGEPAADAPGVARVVTPICYEDAVGRAVRRLVYGSNGDKRADLIVNLTNSAWYPGSSQQPQHLQIATLRCIENRVPMARSVNGGISGFIDSLGRVGTVVEVSGQNQWVQGYALDRPKLDSRRTLYGILGDIPAGCVALLTAVLLVYGKIAAPQSTE